MRVIITSRIYRPEPSAASLLLGCIADGLASRGHEVEVFTAKPPPGLHLSPRSERVRTFPVVRDRNGYVRGYVQYMSFDIPLFFRLLFAKRPAIVFVEPPPTTGAVVRIVCALRRIPYVYDLADIWSDAAGHATSSEVVVRVLRRIERFALRGASALVAISQGVVDRVRELGITTHAEVTGYGADTDTFHFQGGATPLPVFLYAGTHTELHGAPILIEAFAQFNETHPGYRLEFVGNGTKQQAMMQRAAELGVAPLISFENPIPASALKARLSTAVATLATLLPGGGYEYAFTTKIYSSLAAGCPVIFAGPGPTSAFLSEASRHVPAGAAVEYNPERIATAMRNLADRPISANDRAAIAAWAHAEHSMAAVAERVVRIIEASSKQGGSP